VFESLSGQTNDYKSGILPLSCLNMQHFKEVIPLKQQQGFQYFSSVPVLHYLQAVPFIKI
jgi:hypothetical protein